ncbi:hypothetical protein [Izhakiella capsodis]|uniref:hypothetical protein n=1 Tax=Izhakiella capsodis TaxID=1367852 RepID=UPI0015A688D7|nr:hypothetical protein [Izhakiella capsodis]
MADSAPDLLIVIGECPILNDAKLELQVYAGTGAHPGYALIRQQTKLIPLCLPDNR